MRASRLILLAVALGAGCGHDTDHDGKAPAPAVPGVETTVAASEPIRAVVRAFGQVAPSGDPNELRDARAQVVEAKARERVAADSLRRLQALSPSVAPRKDLETAQADATTAKVALERAEQALAGFGDDAGRAPLAADEAWAIAQVVQLDLPGIASGAEARFAADAIPGHTFAARVDGDASYVEPTTRTAPVRLRVKDPDGVLRPGMTGAVQIEVGAPRPVVVVPAAAVVYDAAQPVVFVAETDGRFTPHPVRLGVARAGRIEIASGVDAGTRVVTTGAASLLSATQLPAGGED